MTFFDTHVHFDLFAGTAMAAILARAKQAGIGGMIAVGGSLPANRQACALAQAYPDLIRAALALDRSQKCTPHDLATLEKMLTDNQVAAIGETGLDFHYDRPENAEPLKLFRQMLEFASRFSLPVIIHCRKAENETLKMLTAHAAAWRGRPDAIGVMHCFTGGLDFARAVLELGFHISFSGILTFKKAELIRAAAAIVPDDRLLLETDSPFLAPGPHRGKTNQPAYLPYIAQTLAEIRCQSMEEIARLTTANACRLFNVAPPSAKAADDGA